MKTWLYLCAKQWHNIHVPTPNQIAYCDACDNKKSSHDTHYNLYQVPTTMPRCFGRHQGQTCTNEATRCSSGVLRCEAHHNERINVFLAVLMAGCSICYEVLPESSYVEFLCCGSFYCYVCVMRLFATSSYNNRIPTCPNCRQVQVRYKFITSL